MPSNDSKTGSTIPTTLSDNEKDDASFQLCRKFLLEQEQLWGGDVRKVQVACLAAYTMVLSVLYKDNKLAIANEIRIRMEKVAQAVLESDTAKVITRSLH